MWVHHVHYMLYDGNIIQHLQWYWNERLCITTFRLLCLQINYRHDRQVVTELTATLNQIVLSDALFWGDAQGENQVSLVVTSIRIGRIWAWAVRAAHVGSNNWKKQKMNSDCLLRPTRTCRTTFGYYFGYNDQLQLSYYTQGSGLFRPRVSVSVIASCVFSMEEKWENEENEKNKKGKNKTKQKNMFFFLNYLTQFMFNSLTDNSYIVLSRNLTLWYSRIK